MDDLQPATVLTTRTKVWYDDLLDTVALCAVNQRYAATASPASQASYGPGKPFAPGLARQVAGCTISPSSTDGMDDLNMLNAKACSS